MVGCTYSAIRAVAVLCLSALWVQAAPFEKTVRFTQPDGQQIELWGKGDDFHAVFEHNGYTVVFDQTRKTYTYAKLSADGTQLLPTRLDVGKANPAASGLPQHLRITREAERADVRARFERWDAGMQVSRRWAESKAQMQQADSQAEDGQIVLSPPTFTTTGQKVGLCLLIDFSDDPATIPQADIVDFCNGDDYTGYGNNGSVKKYFLDNSNNLLTYTNVVTAYVRMARPKTTYNNTGVDAGYQANLLIRDALDILKSEPNYTTEILPTFDSLTVDGSKEVIACNVFYAGDNGGVWSYGLWPHSWSLYMVGAQELSPGGKKIFRYQITNIGEDLKIGTFCHENGHMLCGYPDLYDYDYDSAGGAGNFCLMGYGGGDDTNPVQICAYLKRAAGWVTTINFNRSTAIKARMGAAVGDEGFNRVYRYAKLGASTEYFLFENRQQAGRDANIPGPGIAIWHIDQLGDRDNQSLEYNSAHQNFECMLVQADNLWHLQKDPYFDLESNGGDEFDVYYEGNVSPAYSNVFSDVTAPSAKWWDGSNSMLELSFFSTNGTLMTFIQPKAPIVMSPSVLPDGRFGTFYSYAMTASNCASPSVWSIVSGVLPAGLDLSEAGVISGLPGTPETTVFEVSVTGDNGLATTNQFTLTVHPAYVAPFFEAFDSSAGSLPNGWSQQSVSNAFLWSFVNGNSDEVLNPVTAYSGTFNARFRVDALSDKGSAALLVSPMVVFATETRDAQLSFWHIMPRDDSFQDVLRVFYKTAYEGEWNLLETYSQSVGTWTKRTLRLPGPGSVYYVAFEGTGNTGHGVHIDDVEILDAFVPFGFSTASDLPDAVINQLYSTTLAGVGGAAPYSFELTGGSLPGDMLLSSNGVITGTAFALGTSTFTVTITDAESNAVAKVFTLDVVLPRVNLFVQDFENRGALPVGWTHTFVTNTLAWTCQSGGGNADSFHQPQAPHEGMFNGVLWVADYSNHVTRLVSPVINLGVAPVDARLDFWLCMTELLGSQDELRVYYKSAIGDSWSLLASYTNNVADWTLCSIALPNPSSTYYLAFEGNARFGHGVCIDDIRVTDASLAPIITSLSPLPEGLIGNAYTYALTALGGVSPYVWELVSGTLPTGLTLSPEGVLSGIPEVATSATIGVRVVGADGYASTNTLTLKISDIQTLPYAQNFESRRDLPLGWSIQYVNKVLNWTVRNGSNLNPAIPAAAHSGTNNAFLSVFSYSNRGSSRLVMPIMNMGVGALNTKLSFWLCMAKDRDYQDELKVLYKTNASDTVWIQLAEFKSSITAWTNVVLDLPNPSPSYQIAFEGYAKAGYGVCIDDVEVTGDVVYQSAYEQWKQAMFGADAGDPLIAGDLADPDVDGIENWREYAMALDPLTPDAEGLPTGGVTAGYLTLSYRENQAASDVLFEVEACTDLLLQDWTTNGVSEILRGDSNLWWQVTTRHDVPVTNAPQRFLRLKLTWPAP